MGLPTEAERCPQCSSEAYRYDSVCHIWCCGQCQTTETTDEKAEREDRMAVVRAVMGDDRAGF